MRIRWLSTSQRDLARLYEFLKDVNPNAAARRVQAIIAAIEQLPDYPHLGSKAEAYLPRDVRSLIVSDYEVHYEILADAIVILRLWHTREDR